MSRVVKRIAAGAGWVYAYRWGERLLDLVAIVVLARLLTPEDFGLVAIAASVVTIIEGVSDFDVAKAIIRSRDDHRSLFDSAWTLSTLRGVVAALLMTTIAVLLSDETIARVVLVLAPGPLVKGLANPRFVTFERDLVFSRLAWLTIGSRIASFVVTLLLAILYRSYWALVVGMLVGMLASTLLSYALRPYRPRFSLGRAREIFAFSGWMSLTTMVTTLSMETDKIIVGRLLGITDAGLYFMTQRVGVLPTRELISPLQRILFPSFSELVDDRPRLRRVVVESLNVLGSLGLPAGVGFALVADAVVPLALGDQWLSIVPLLGALVPFLGIRATVSMTLPCVMALGETKLLFKVSFVYALVHVPAFVAGTWLYGLTGAIGSIVAAGAVYIALNVWLLRRTLAIRPLNLLAPLSRPLAATAVMAGVVLTIGASAPEGVVPALGAWSSLLTRAGAGAGAFALSLYAIWRLQGRPSGIETRLLQVFAR